LAIPFDAMSGKAPRYSASARKWKQLEKRRDNVLKVWKMSGKISVQTEGENTYPKPPQSRLHSSMLQLLPSAILDSLVLVLGDF
jgi:hypothetical protein